MIEPGDYFVINRPRQFGKTTTIYMVNKYLKASDEYFPIKMSFEGIGSESYKSEAAFSEAFLLQLKRIFKTSGNKEMVQFVEAGSIVNSINKLDLWFTDLVEKTREKVVLMIDEVDKSSNNLLFLDFLGMLRDKYLRHNQGEDPTFHSIILAGVHDVKSLKVKLRHDDEAKYNSPWNIAVDFNVDMSFNPKEISSMLEEYINAAGIKMDSKATAEALYYYTSGYPFLVSKLCKIIDEEILVKDNRKQWQKDDIEIAVNRLLNLKNTNFDSVIKNLENNKDLYVIVEKMLLFGETIEYNRHSSIINKGVMYGIFKQNGDYGFVDIHNRVYKELIYNYMTTNFRLKVLLDTDVSDYNFRDNLINKDGSLNIEKVLMKFQEFMKKEYSRRDKKFLERNGRLIFLAFIKPIINGRGYDFKEVQVSEEKRIDVLVIFDHQKFVVELKVWRGKEAHQRGIKQLCDYLDKMSIDNGYLIIFDFTKKGKKEFKQEKITSENKEIFAVWV
jgi:hypothetical protein